MVSVSNRVSSSYSCPVCCPDSFIGLQITPASSSGPVGGTATLAVDGFLQDCNGFTHGPYAWSASSWWIENTNVISLAMVSQGTAQMGCLSVGQSQFYGSTIEVWYTNDGMDCYSNYSSFNDGCCATVTPTVTIQFDGTGIPLSSGTPPQGSPAYVNSVTMTAQVNPSGGTYSWSTSSNKVTLLNATSATVTVRSVTASDMTNDVTITVTYTVNQTPGTAQISTTVQKPTLMGFVSVDFNRAKTDCPSGQAGWEKKITWQVQDQTSGHNAIAFALPTYDTIANTTPNSCSIPAQ